MYSAVLYLFSVSGVIVMKKITVIGGDKRLRIAEKILQKDFKVDTIGLYGDEKGNMADSDVLLLPVPTTRDNVTVNAPFSREKIYLEEIKTAAKGKLILSCGYFFEGMNCTDYGKDEGYCILNAVPTAEGAIALAMDNSDFTLWRSRVLVIGCGRCGRVLAERLKALGAFVTVSARKESDFAYLDSSGLGRVYTNSLNEIPLDYHIIFNTVDAKVIADSSLENCKTRLMIDLSSKGGFDTEKARFFGITAFKAPGLPGKAAPQTAGEILAKTVTEIIISHI